ncbi:MAG: OmpA family protein [Alphaproteobacteria bacterium]|nr:OmpA family protein [Alphaproteobacteria bacterium]
MPIVERPEQGVAVAWYVKTDFNTGLPESLPGDPTGSVTGWVAAELRTGAKVRLVGNAGARLMPSVALPGLSWGRRFEYGLGARVAWVGPLSSTVELRGSSPLGPAPTDATSYHPVEVMGHLGLLLPKDMALQLGGGTGLTRGLGSPAWRASVVLDYRKREHPDRDADGLVDPRDICPDDPEDVDGHRDLDGCPDPDNDQDGLLDVDDLCPNQPEVFNDHLDEDGCPDRIAELRLVVRSEAPELLESASVTVGAFQEPGEEPLQVIPGERVLLRMAPGEYPVTVTAEGHHPLERRVELPSGGAEVELVLAPVRFGEVWLRAVDEAGAPVAAFLREPEGLRPVPAEGLGVEREVGLRRFAVRAAGYLPAEVEVEVLPGERVEVALRLTPSGIRVNRSRVELGRPVPFELDSAALLPEGELLLDELAALLRATPEIALLRVEGHADERGGSRYNLELSQRRAEAVVAALVEAGVEPERLQALGTGEARPLEGEQASRRVEFLVLIWDDEAGAAPSLSY